MFAVMYLWMENNRIIYSFYFLTNAYYTKYSIVRLSFTLIDFILHCAY